MMEGGDGVRTFPLVFFDGEREINLGTVKIHPSLELKNFQSGLSRRIGISPNQMTVYLVDGTTPRSSYEPRRKIPITNKVNFALIGKETDCFFLVVLKRTRKNRKPRPNSKQRGFDVSGYEYLSPSPEKTILLRRNQPDTNNPPFSGYLSPSYNQLAADYNARWLNLQLERENYAMMMNSNPISALDFDSESFTGIEEPSFGASPMVDRDSFPRIEESLAMDRNRPSCEDCAYARRNRVPAAFHRCVLDPITAGFRSEVGPIAPPRKAFL